MNPEGERAPRGGDRVTILPFRDQGGLLLAVVDGLLGVVEFDDGSFADDVPLDFLEIVLGDASTFRPPHGWEPFAPGWDAYEAAQRGEEVEFITHGRTTWQHQTGWARIIEIPMHLDETRGVWIADEEVQP